MREERVFRVTANQYQLFKFSVERPTALHIRMMASAPVNVMLLDSESRAEYESRGAETHSYEYAWGRRVELDETVKVTGPETWYLVVEGNTEPSRGRIEILK